MRKSTGTASIAGNQDTEYKPARNQLPKDSTKPGAQKRSMLIFSIIRYKRRRISTRTKTRKTDRMSNTNRNLPQNRTSCLNTSNNSKNGWETSSIHMNTDPPSIWPSRPRPKSRQTTNKTTALSNRHVFTPSSPKSTPLMP